MQRLLCGKIFEDLYKQTNQLIIEQIDLLLSKYQEKLFWQTLKEMLIRLKQKQKHKLVYNILTKLMDEQTITVFQTDYEFLFFGKTINKQIRMNFVRKTEEEENKFHLYSLIFLLDMNHLLQYTIIVNLLFERSQITLKQLLDVINDIDVKTRVKQRIQKLRKDENMPQSDNQILSNSDLIKIYQEILPFNLTALKLLLEQYLKIQDFSSYLDKQICVLIGPTGVGKSTLILYLLGYSFKKQPDSKGYEQYVPINLQDQHKIIETRYDTESVTNKIHIVSGEYNNKTIYLTDTPGDADSRGITRIFFNSMLRNILFQQLKKIKIIKVVDIRKILYLKEKGLKLFANQIISNFKFFDENDQFNVDATDLGKKLTIVLNMCDPQYSLIPKLIDLLRQILIKRSRQLKKQQHVVFTFLLRQMFKKQPHQIQFAISTNFSNDVQKRKRLLDYIMKKDAVNPKDFIKKTFNPQVERAIKNTKYYFFKNILNSLQKEHDQTTLYYYRKMDEILKFSPQSLKKEQIQGKIKDKFNQHYGKFLAIISNGSEKTYNQDDFKLLNHHKDKLTFALRFRPYIFSIKTISSLQEHKVNLIDSYRQKLSQVFQPDIFFNNYQKFMTLFGIDGDPTQPLVLANQNKANRIYEIVASNFRDLDICYNQIIQNTEKINRLNPNYHNHLLNQLNSYMQSNILQVSAQMQNSFNQEFEFLQQIGQLCNFLLRQPIQRELTICQHILMKYRRYNQSSVMSKIKLSLQNQGRTHDEQILINKLKNKLLEKLTEFRDILVSNQSRIDKIIVSNWRIFINPYLVIRQIHQQLQLKQQRIKSEVLVQKNIISEKILQFLDMFKRLLNQSQISSDFRVQTQQIKKLREKQELHCTYLAQIFNQAQFLDAIRRILNQQTQNIKDNSSIQSSDHMKEFQYTLEKMRKLRLIQQVFPEINQHVMEINKKIENFFRSLGQSSNNYLFNNKRLEKFIYVIRGRQYVQNLEFLANFYRNLKQIHSGQSFLAQLEKRFKEIYNNCWDISKMQITFQHKGNTIQYLDNNKIQCSKLFDVFDFLNKLVSISEFQPFFDDYDARNNIIISLSKQLQVIQKDVKQEAEQKKLYMRDYFFSDRMHKLDYISKESFILRNSTKNLIKNTKIQNLKKKYTQIWQQAYKKSNDSDQQVQLNIASYSSSLQVFLIRFLKIYKIQKHRVSIKKKLQSQLLQFLKSKLQSYEDTYQQNHQNIITRHYSQLKKIQNRLKQEAELQFQVLNSFLAGLDRKIEYIIKDYYRNSFNEFNSRKNIKQANLQINKIKNILQITMFDKNNVQDKELFPKIHALMNELRSYEQILRISQQQIVSSNPLDLYQQFNKIKLVLMNDNKTSVRQKIRQSIRFQIGQLKDNSRPVDPIALREQFQILQQITSIIYLQQIERKKVLYVIKELLQQKKQIIQAKIARDITILSKNYGKMMQMEYICQLFGLGMSIDNIRNNKRQLLNNILYNLQEKQTDIQGMFKIINELFWVQNISSIISSKFLQQNKAWQQKYIDFILSLKFYPKIEIFMNKKILVSQQSQSIDTQNFTKFFNQFEKYKHKLYNPNLYETIKNIIKQKLIKARNHSKNNCLALNSILFQIYPEESIQTVQKQKTVIPNPQQNPINRIRTKKKEKRYIDININDMDNQPKMP